MKKKRNIDRVPRGQRRHPPVPAPVFLVTAKEVAGAPLEFLCHDEQKARKHAIWWHNHPGIVDVLLQGPSTDGPRLAHLPTATDVKLGEQLSILLEDSKLCPTVRYDIDRWMDSKAWGHVGPAV